MSIWNKGRINVKPSEGCYWKNGVLTVDGTRAEDVVAAGVRRGLIERPMFSEQKKVDGRKGNRRPRKDVVKQTV